jgi:hypothetical protein
MTAPWVWSGWIRSTGFCITVSLKATEPNLIRQGAEQDGTVTVWPEGGEGKGKFYIGNLILRLCSGQAFENGPRIKSGVTITQPRRLCYGWIPAFAGMTKGRFTNRPYNNRADTQVRPYGRDPPRRTAALHSQAGIPTRRDATSGFGAFAGMIPTNCVGTESRTKRESARARSRGRVSISEMVVDPSTTAAARPSVGMSGGRVKPGMTTGRFANRPYGRNNPQINLAEE